MKARVFAEKHNGCRNTACVQRVRAKHQAREIRRLTPYRCSFGRSAIPCGIVLCESGGKWTAYNRSGAASLYQIMAMHGRPWPVRTRADRLAHHRIASRLWAGGAGRSQWVCRG
ncbi:MAG: hypothetical protein WKF96_16535 [Solirubrobacteraceae bacterium]